MTAGPPGHHPGRAPGQAAATRWTNASTQVYTQIQQLKTEMAERFDQAGR